MFRQLAVATASALVIAGLAASPAVASPPPPPGDDDRLAVYTGTVGVEGLAAIVGLGVDRAELVTSPRRGRSGRGRGAGDPERRPGREARGGRHDARAEAARRRAATLARRRWCVPHVQRTRAASSKSSWRVAAAYPKIAEFRVIGKTVQGKDIGAIRLTKNVEEGEGRQAPDDALPRRPARPRVDHARDGPTAARPLRRRRTAPTSGSPASSTPPSCGSSRSPTPTATTTRSRTASGCGARTCATTTATA